MAALETDRPYLSAELTLDELAAELAVPRTHLSQVVNERFGQSLTDLLGGYRSAWRTSGRATCTI
jgi:AraC-like DNA-binding protein